MLDRPRLDAVIDPVVRAHGGEVVDVEWKQEPGGWVLRVFVERLGSADGMCPASAEGRPDVGVGKTTENAAVSLELCAGVARDLSPALDVADLIPNRYHLEVSSPGVERALRTAKDYARFAGKKAKVRLREPVDGQKVLVGILAADALPAAVTLREGPKTRVIPMDAIASANLVFELGPAPKPGKATKREKRTRPDKTAATRREPSPKHRGETSNS